VHKTANDTKQCLHSNMAAENIVVKNVVYVFFIFFLNKNIFLMFFILCMFFIFNNILTWPKEAYYNVFVNLFFSLSK